MIFVDTSFFFALAFAKDRDHSRAVEAFQRFREVPLDKTLVTTNHVVGETLTLTRRRIGHSATVQMGRHLYSQRLARIHQATQEEELEAFELLARYQDKVYSAVDCLSFVVMDKLGIREALTLDSDFAHRFVTIPGPRGSRR